MRIGIDGRLWNQTGVGRYIRNLAINLQKIDEKNDYIFFVREEDSESVARQIKNPKWKLAKVDIKWHSLKEQYLFPKILDKENLDLVHFPYFSLPIRYNKPFVVTIHDLILNHFPTGKASTLPLPLYRLKTIGYDKVIKHAVKQAKKIIVPLNAVKSDVINTFNVPENKIIVTYEGFDLDKSRKASKNVESIIAGYQYFLAVGNAYPHKNLERLIEAFVKLKLTGNNLKLLLVGKDDYFYKRLEAEVKKKNISSVEFLHNVNDSDLVNLYSHALALVAPSLMEGFGLPAIEAISNNCLVLASDISSFREVCGNYAEYFNPLDTVSISEKMQLVLSSGKDSFKKIKEDAKERLKLFSWGKMAQETLEVYESCFSL